MAGLPKRLLSAAVFVAAFVPPWAIVTIPVTFAAVPAVFSFSVG